MSRSVQRITRASLVALAAVLATGCARTTVESAAATDYDRADIVQSVEFWHTLPSRSAVTNDEGFHGLILFADENDPNDTYEQRVDYFKALGWLDESFDEPANLAMQRGTLAKLLSHAMKIDGGVMMRLSGKSPRYATRELVHLGIMPQGTDQMVLSGYQYIGVISKAQDYELLRQGRREKEVPPSAEELDARDAEAQADETEPAPEDAETDAAGN